MAVRDLKKVKGKLGTVTRGFTDFIHDYGVMPLAIGVVIGTAVNDLVKTLVDGLFSPLVSLLIPSIKLQTFVVNFHGSTFKIGAVMNATISFLVVAWLVYLGAKFILRNEELLKKK